MLHIRGFHALRAFSVLLVVISHVGIIESATNPYLLKFFSVFNATYGVKTFFVLSGFLITTILIREADETGLIHVPKFMAKRAFRILPLYFLIIAVAAAMILMGRAEPSWTAMAFGTAYVYNFIPKAENVNYLSHLWSLAVEEQYYLVWPILFAAFARKRLPLIAICVAFVVACYALLGRDFGDLSDKFYTQRWTIPAIYPIAIGSLLALTVAENQRAFGSGYSLLIAVALILLPLAAQTTPAIEIFSTFGIAGLIAWIYLNQRNRIVQSLDWKPIFFLGQISYGLYMWQGLLTGNGPYRSFAGFPPDPILGALLTLPVAAVSFYAFEAPISRLGRRWLAGRIKVAPPTTELPPA